MSSGRSIGAVVAVFALALGLRTSAASPMMPGAPTPWLGVTISDSRGIPGARIGEIIRGTPADAAGLEIGDVVVEISGEKVATAQGLIAAVKGHRIGDQVFVSYYRHNTRQETTVTLTGMPDDSEILYRRLVDEVAPNFTMVSAQIGKTVRLSDFRGKVVVIEFLSTSTLSAVDTLPPLSQLAASHPGDVVVLGVSGDSTQSMRTFASRHGVLFPLLQDFGGNVARDRYRIEHPPALIVVGRDGLVRYAGYGSGATVDDAVFAAKRAMRRMRGALRDYY